MLKISQIGVSLVTLGIISSFANSSVASEAISNSNANPDKGASITYSTAVETQTPIRVVFEICGDASIKGFIAPVKMKGVCLDIKSILAEKPNLKSLGELDSNFVKGQVRAFGVFEAILTDPKTVVLKKPTAILNERVSFSCLEMASCTVNAGSVWTTLLGGESYVPTEQAFVWVVKNQIVAKKSQAFKLAGEPKCTSTKQGCDGDK